MTKYKIKYSNKGIGSLLLRKVIDKFNNVDKLKIIELQVRKSNLRAIKLYEKFGFIKHTLDSKYYEDGEDAWIMRLLK